MKIEIIQAEANQLNECKAILQKSELGRIYFSDESKASRVLSEAISKKEVYVAINKEGENVGFIWFTQDGTFYKYPYLHMIVVKEQYRNGGIGQRLLQYFEEVSSKRASKVFLLVGDFNERAKELYKRIGYKIIGTLPNFYKEGVNEVLMMKELL